MGWTNEAELRGRCWEARDFQRFRRRLRTEGSCESAIRPMRRARDGA
jgi:hypothetical protein